MQNNIDSNQKKKLNSHGPNHLIKYHGYNIEKNIKNMIVSELTVNQNEKVLKMFLWTIIFYDNIHYTNTSIFQMIADDQAHMI